MKKAVAIFMTALMMISLFTLALDVNLARAGEASFQEGLVGYWRFNEGSGSATADSSGNGNAGTLNNGPAWVDGRFGEALSFDGDDDYVRVEASSSLDVTSQVTVETWVYPRAYVDSTGMASAIISRTHLNGGHIYMLSIYPDSHKASYSVNPIPWEHSSDADLPLNTWTHLAMTYDGVYVRLYMNGAFDSSYPLSESIQTTSNWLAFGCIPCGPHGGVGTYAYFNGVIDDVRIYNRALSQQEIQSDMNSEPPPIYDVTFSETGLPTGAKWWVVLDGELQETTSDSITFIRQDGVYSYYILVPYGYTLPTAQRSGTVTVNGGNEDVPPVTFSLDPSEIRTQWDINRDSYNDPNPTTPWSDEGVCYGMASTAVMYFMRYRLEDTSYPCFPLQSPQASSTSDLNLDAVWIFFGEYGWLYRWFDTLNNASLAVVFSQLQAQKQNGVTTLFESTSPTWFLAWENRQFMNLIANLSIGYPVVLDVMDREMSPWDWNHAVVAFGAKPQVTGGLPTGVVDIYIYDPQDPKETKTATYNTIDGSFSYRLAYDLFCVIDPQKMLPHAPVTPSNYPIIYELHDGLGNSVTDYTMYVADQPLTVTDISNGRNCQFSGEDSSSFVCGIPGSSGIIEGNVQVIAVPGSPSSYEARVLQIGVGQRMEDLDSSQSTVLITHTENRSDQLVGYGYFLNVRMTQGSLNYTVTPSNNSLLVSAGDAALNVSVTFFSATHFSHSIAQVPTLQVDAMETVNVTRPSPTVIAEVASSKEFVGQRYNTDLNVTIKNLENFTETINVTIYANGAIIKTYTNLTLEANSTTFLSLAWNTTGFAMGNYTINAYMELGAGGTLSGFNTTGCPAKVTYPGDTDGNFNVDIFDIVRMAGVYGTSQSDPRYNPNCDINGSGKIDIFDIVIAAGHYGDSW
jgi:hypothetical protein